MKRQRGILRVWDAGVVGSCALLFLAFAARAQEAEPVYDVELVVFQHLGGNATPEDWTLEEQLAARNQPVVTAVDEGPLNVPVTPSLGNVNAVRQALPREKFKLSAMAAALQRSRSYRTVAHFGWSQVGTPLNGTTPTPLGELLPGALTGSAALARGRYLHLTLDLAFQPEGDTRRYILRQTRRMRSNERHYIDHPQFGVIALVTPQGAGQAPR